MKTYIAPLTLMRIYLHRDDSPSQFKFNLARYDNFLLWALADLKNHMNYETECYSMFGEFDLQRCGTVNNFINVLKYIDK